MGKFSAGKGYRFTSEVEGGEALAAKLAALGESATAVLLAAVREALGVAAGPIMQDAPGPHILVEQSDEPNTDGTKAFEIGPDKEHWFYRFFETGVQPFEIDLARGRSKRSGVYLKTGKGRGGRKLRGNAQALMFTVGGETVYAKHVDRGPMAAKPFMRKNFLGNTDNMEARFGQEIETQVIDPQLETK